MKKTFEVDQWLIRRWEKENGGETDFVRFDAEISDKMFKYSKFYRIKRKKVENLSNESCVLREIEYEDYRMSLQFRPATKAEIQKYAALIMTS